MTQVSIGFCTLDCIFTEIKLAAKYHRGKEITTLLGIHAIFVLVGFDVCLRKVKSSRLVRKKLLNPQRFLV